MDSHQAFGGKKGVGIGAAVALILVSVAIATTQLRGPTPPKAANRAFFTIDDGKTWFPDDIAKVPPFEKDGKQAVRAYVFRSAKGLAFVNYLARFTPEVKRAKEAALKSDASQSQARTGDGGAQLAYASGREVKRPGDAAWISGSDYRHVGDVITLKCPDGSTEATAVEP